MAATTSGAIRSHQETALTGGSNGLVVSDGGEATARDMAGNFNGNLSVAPLCGGRLTCPACRGRRREVSGSLSKYLSPGVRYRLNYRTRIPGILTAMVLATSMMIVPLHAAFAGRAADVVPVSNADGRLGMCDVL